jgi:hypothetical protein
MKTILLLLTGLFALASSPSVVKTIEGEEQEFQVTIHPETGVIEVVAERENAPSHMKFRLLRKDEKPIEVQLRTFQPPQGPVRYSGRLDAWNDSHIGFELVFSFDRKVWKKLR